MSDVELDDLFGADDDAQDDQVDRVSEGSDDGAPHRGGSGEASSGGAAPRGSSPDGEPAGGSGEPEDEAALFGELEDEEEGPVDADPVGPAVDVVAPLMARPEPGSVLLLRLPNILHVDTRPYDPAEFDGGVETFVDERGVSRTRPRDINVVRWRYRRAEGGGLERESNARYVTWSDGSASVLLGDEMLQLSHQPAPRPHTYLCAVRYNAVQGLVHLPSRATLAPSSVSSKLHQRLRMSVQAAAAKEDKVRVHYASRNPETEKAEAEKRAAEAAHLKAARERVERGVPRSRRAAPPSLTVDYLEGDEEEQQEAVSDDDLQQRRWGASEDLRRRRDEDEEGEERLRSAKRPALSSLDAAGSGRGRGRLPPSDDDDDEDDDDDDDGGIGSGEPSPPPAGRSASPAGAAAGDAEQRAPAGVKVRRGAILDDDDD